MGMGMGMRKCDAGSREGGGLLGRAGSLDLRIATRLCPTVSAVTSEHPAAVRRYQTAMVDEG